MGPAVLADSPMTAGAVAGTGVASLDLLIVGGLGLGQGVDGLGAGVAASSVQRPVVTGEVRGGSPSRLLGRLVPLAIVWSREHTTEVLDTFSLETVLGKDLCDQLALLQRC
jgi:hypothetical protein